MTTVLPAVFRQLRQSSQFLAVMKYTNNFGEVSDFQLCFNIDYKSAVVKAMHIWRGIQPSNPIERQALDGLMQSYEDSMWGKNPRATASHVYERIVDGNGDYIKGVKLFSNMDEVHLFGLLLNKRVIRPGRNPYRRQSPLTQQKNKYKALTALSKFRQFRLVRGNFGEICVKDMTLTHRDLVRQLVEQSS